MAAAQGAPGQGTVQQAALPAGIALRRHFSVTTVLDGYWRASDFACIRALSLRESLDDGACWLLAGEHFRCIGTLSLRESLDYAQQVTLKTTLYT
ncbi:hypothetical protein D3C73_1341430 [compost metagenome]